MTREAFVCIISIAFADVAHPVERHLAKVEVASSSLVIRSNAPVAQLDRVTGYEPVGQGFESLPARHKRNVFCLPRQKAFFLAFYGKIRSKSHKLRQNGLRDGLHGCPGARFFVSGNENSPKNVVYFLRFLALQRTRQSTARGDLNLKISSSGDKNSHSHRRYTCHSRQCGRRSYCRFHSAGHDQQSRYS